ncbi:MAG: CoA pyrophosphatase [Promethearchaeota archaeon]|nr:MAG: CoA pyrophosphatase [Candidatus Lokiarchaeota archaeon]
MIYNKALIKSKLIPCDSPNRISLKDDYFTNSAVLFSIIPYKNRPFDLILIHRTDRGTRHRGEVSFPGGKFESQIDKTLLETALRETEEEIGVPRDNIQLLGCLDDFPTMTKYIITPFIATIPKDQKLIKEEKEVRRILKVPIDFFIKRENFREQAVDIGGNKFPIFYFNYIDDGSREKYTIWGATAYMISTFIETIYGITMSNLGLKRFKLERIKDLKEYIKYRNQITKKF